MGARFLPLLLLLCALALPARAEHITIIAHTDSPIGKLTPNEISALYLGRRVAGEYSERIVVIDHPRDSHMRNLFFQSLNGMNLSRVNAYWARLQFSGQMQPPVALPDSQSVLEYVRKNRLAIGYVDSSTVITGVKPLLTLQN